MKTMLITTPIRPVPTTFPPLGSLSLINALRKEGISNVEFYNIDANRPAYDEVLAHIEAARPDVLGVSAVVSTAYAYTKRLTLDVKAILPDTLIIVGGSLAGSAEILLRKTGVDLCALGEGERIFCNVVKRAEVTRDAKNYHDIPGLVLLNKEGRLINTGYEAPLPKDEIYDIEWDDLAKSADIGMFIYDAFDEDGKLHEWFKKDSRAYEPHRRGGKVGSIVCAKGCVSRCTFCHRWDKGIRYIPVDIIMKRIEELIEKYNVRFFDIVDENFGTDRRWLKEFCEKIKPYDILWFVSGMRVNTASPEHLQMMKEAGCVATLFGMETGSEKMLKVMDKKVKLQDNYNAIKWVTELNLSTVIQLVIGMPGEAPDTIRESIEFCKYATSLSPDQNPNDLSINYAQALPGTPLYEFGRSQGIIGKDLDAEEKYLLNISDRDAADEHSTLNFTDYPTLECQTWRPRIKIEVNYHYVKKYSLKHYHKVLLDSGLFQRKKPNDSGYFANPKRLVDKSITTDRIHETTENVVTYGNERELPSLWSLVRQGKYGLAEICYPVRIYRFRHFLPFMILAKNFHSFGIKGSLKLFSEYLQHKAGLKVKPIIFRYPHKSLRKIVEDDIGLTNDTEAMLPLRKGR